MTSLKQEYLSRIPEERAVVELKKEVVQLKEQAKVTRELEVQKSTLEERCHCF
jgi:hypothetical protein